MFFLRCVTRNRLKAWKPSFGGNDNGHGQDISKGNGHNGEAHPEEKFWRQRPQS